MSKYEKSFIHELKEPVSISKDGKLIDAYSLEVFAPRNVVFNLVSVLDTEFNKAKLNSETHSSEMLKNLTKEQIEAIQNLRKNEKEEIEIKDPIDVVNFMIKNGSNISLCYETLGLILSSNNNPLKLNCMIDTQAMKKINFDELNLFDTKIILGKYIISFLDYSQST